MTAGTGTETYYQRRAAEYDQVYEKPERQADLELLRPQIASLLAGRRVLEVAAGTGWWTEVYADGAANVVATDVNPETLAVASARRAWPATAEFLRCDAFSLGELPGSFDAAFVGFFWSHVPLSRLDEFIAGVAGRVGAGGRLVFIDNQFVAGSNHPVTRRDTEGNTYQQRRLEDGTQWEVLKNFPTREELEDRLGRLSPDVSVRQFTYYWVAVCQLR